MRTPSGSVSIPAAAGLTAPRGSEGLSVTLRGTSVRDGFPELAAAEAVFDAEVRGRRISLKDIFAAASRLERAYAEQGFVLVRIVIPPQKLDNGGVLSIKVIDGYVEGVELKGIPAGQQALVRSRIADMIGRKRVTQAELERRLLLINELPGLRARSTLAPGLQAKGGTLIVLEGTHDPLSGSVGGDNRSSQSMGGGSVNYSLSANSVFGFGEQAYMMASSGPNPLNLFDSTSQLAMIGGGITIPLGVDGLSLNFEGIHSVTRAKPAAYSPRSVGTMNRVEARLVYPLIKTQTQSLTFQGSYLWLQQGLEAVDFGQQLYLDRYHVVRAQADHRLLFDGGLMLNTVATFSRGLGGRGATEALATGVGLSRADAYPVFNKFVLVVRANMALPFETQLAVTARGQTSFKRAMLTGESLALDGSDSVSGLTPGSFSADQGGTLRAEWSKAFPTNFGSVQAIASPYLFGAVGVGIIVKPNPTQHERMTASTFGAGLRLNLGAASANTGASFGVEYARSHSDADDRVSHRVNFSTSLRF